MLLFECRAGGVRFCGEFREFILQGFQAFVLFPHLHFYLFAPAREKIVQEKSALQFGKPFLERLRLLAESVFSRAQFILQLYYLGFFLVKFRVKMVFFLSCADIFAGPPFKNGGIEEHIELFDSYAEYAGEEEVAEFMDYHQNRES